MAVVSMRSLLETGVHFGHRAKKWNPKMKPYIFTERNGIHIIDLQQTLTSLEEAYDLVRDTVSKGGKVLFCGTKRQAQETIQQEAERAGMPYVSTRWLGGTLTNWKTIKARLEQMRQFETEIEEGGNSFLTKKERLQRARIVEKLNLRLGGLRDMGRPPALIFIVDVKREINTVKEANTMGIPVLAMVDTNCDPDKIDYVIPANDDAIRAIKLIASKLADAALEGQAISGKDDTMEAAVARIPANIDLDEYERNLDKELEGDDAYLGKSTLSTLSSGLNFDDEK